MSVARGDAEYAPVLGAASDASDASAASRKRLMLVASNVPDKADLVAATKPWVSVVQYEYDMPLDQDSLKWIGLTCANNNLALCCMHRPPD